MVRGFFLPQKRQGRVPPSKTLLLCSTSPGGEQVQPSESWRSAEKTQAESRQITPDLDSSPACHAQIEQDTVTIDAHPIPLS